MAKIKMAIVFTLTPIRIGTDFVKHSVETGKTSFQPELRLLSDEIETTWHNPVDTVKDGKADSTILAATIVQEAECKKLDPDLTWLWPWIR